MTGGKGNNAASASRVHAVSDIAAQRQDEKTLQALLSFILDGSIHRA